MPGIYCSVIGCKNHATRCRNCNSDISFHSFPKDANVKQEWIDFCQRGSNWVPSSYSRICSIHFAKDDFELNYKKELLNIPTKRKLKKKAVPSHREHVCEDENFVEEIILQYTDSDEDRQTNFKVVDIDETKEDSSSENLEEEEEPTPPNEIDMLRKEIANLKRKTEEQEETIRKMRTLNENLAKDLHNERHRNLYLKNKMNLLEQERVQKVSQRMHLTNGVKNSQDQILLIVTNDEKDKLDK